MTLERSRAAVTATLVCGALDILSAFVFAGIRGTTPVQVLRTVASGPFGAGMRDTGLAGAAIGLLTHFAIMAVMVAVFVHAASRIAAIRVRPMLAGTGYGLLLYGVMYWIVVPLRWGNFPRLAPWPIGTALFAHIVCVGIPMALITLRYLRADDRR
ncbi:hypothetical protein G4G27_14795 [Sphingomonas sp. So64.6b]|uniref:hypothetical protein n=1 Tax=Sphingomonas sp. So64.6b TaxID=2997354 RepID=UPI001603D1A6|nr:hypothetical protein [Sphingomonas sp. So64.6b]QNA85120.1 hypothetical protein G4G27_14795 [Sphingomonas sp. So64.6b]